MWPDSTYDNPVEVAESSDQPSIIYFDLVGTRLGTLGKQFFGTLRSRIVGSGG